MTLNDVKKMELNELLELRSSVNLVTEKYAKELTTYATMNGDMSFTNLDSRSQDIANKRIKTIGLLNTIDRMIETKVLNLADEL